MSTPCTCPMPPDTATSFKPTARSHHTQNIRSSAKKMEAPLVHLYSRRFSAVGVCWKRSLQITVWPS
jgi:hypothetical protein